MSSSSATTTSPLALDLGLLISQFADFAAFSPAPDNPWNDKDGTAVAFVMADSEYRLWKPTTDATDLQLTSSMKESCNAYFAGLQEAVTLNRNLSNEQEAQFLASITAAQNQINTASSLPALKISASFDHIRNNQQDDHCILELEVAWLSSIEAWFPVTLSAGFSWADQALAVPDQVINLLRLPSRGPAQGYFTKMIPVYGEIAAVLKYISIALSAWNLFIDTLNNRADDGGRLYFPAAVLQGFTRIFTSITPADAPVATGTMSAPDIDGTGKMWTAHYGSLSVLSGHTYRSDQYTLERAIQYSNSPGTYRTFLPDLGWLPGGAGTLLTFKIAVEGTNGFATTIMLFDNHGALQMAAGIVQVKTNVIISGPPIWRTSSTETNAQIVDALINAYFEERYMWDYGLNNVNNSDEKDAKIGDVMQEVADTYANNLRAISVSLRNTGLPQLPSLSLSEQRYDYGERPFAAVASSSRAVEVHFNSPKGLFSEVLNTSGAISANDRGGQYQNGQDPSVAVLADGTTVLEVHGGDANNKLFYNVGTFDNNTGKMSLPDSGVYYDDGEDPCVTMAVKDGVERILEVHRSPVAGSTDLYYNIPTRQGRTLSWPGSGTRYAGGITPFVTFAPDQDTVLVAHDDGAMVKVKTGNFKSSGTIDWIYNYTVMPGTVPTIGVTSDNRVVLIARNSASALVYSLGQFYIDGAYRGVRWTVAGVRLGNGHYPCLARMSGGKCLLVYQGEGTGSIPMMGGILSVNVPAGFYD